MKVAPFTCDATPPIGHPLCGGWIKPVVEVVDRQFAHGIIIVPDNAEPVAMMVVDWCWIRGEAHEHWREALANAIGTRPNRISIHCIHAHDAPMADVEADRLLAREGLELRTLLPGFLEDVVKRSCEAAREAAGRLQPVTHIGTGQSKVEKVACNRRVVGASGKVELWRGSSCKDAKAAAAPEGLIDPWLKCVSFWNGEECLAAMHYYACHPMSYYGKGGVTPDFAGLAREKRRRDTPGIAHIYFNGCGGNVSAGKYNDGAPEKRPVLMKRIHSAMCAAFEATRRERIESFAWSAEAVHLPMSEQFTREYFTQRLKNPKGTVAERIKGAMGVASWDRYEAGKKIDVTCMRINSVYLLHLPSEAFVEYQLAAQQIVAARHRPASQAAGQPSPFVAVAAYADCSPAYIPFAEHYPQGGYEISMAWCGPKSEVVLKDAMRQLVKG